LNQWFDWKSGGSRQDRERRAQETNRGVSLAIRKEKPAQTLKGKGIDRSMGSTLVRKPRGLADDVGRSMRKRGKKRRPAKVGSKKSW